MTRDPFWRDESVTIWHADALDLPLGDESVDLVVTSPPYWSLRSYQDNGEHYDGQIGSETTPSAFVDALLAATREMVRVLKRTGSIWINLGDKYATAPSGPRKLNEDGWDRDRSYTDVRQPRRDVTVSQKSLLGLPWRYAIRCIDELGLILRAEVIWDKPNGMPESVTDRVRRNHEHWFHFTTQTHYFAEMDGIREPHVQARSLGPESGGFGRAYQDRQNDGGGNAGSTSRGNPLGKLPGSVWTVPTQPLRVPPELGIDHFAAFPMEWPRRLIRGWSPRDSVILDPFGGTGTTALVARALARQAHHVDLSMDYCRLARWRVTDPGELARAMQVEKPPAQPEDMDSLLDLLGDGDAA